MLLDEDETQTVSTALYQYQSTIDRLKFITRNLKDAIDEELKRIGSDGKWPDFVTERTNCGEDEQ